MAEALRLADGETIARVVELRTTRVLAATTNDADQRASFKRKLDAADDADNDGVADDDDDDDDEARPIAVAQALSGAAALVEGGYDDDDDADLRAARVSTLAGGANPLLLQLTPARYILRLVSMERV